jgi:non-ribosomal peptide synthetase component F
MTLLAAFEVLLQRYTGLEDIVVGTDVANRNRAETEPLIGFFVNLLSCGLI